MLPFTFLGLGAAYADAVSKAKWAPQPPPIGTTATLSQPLRCHPGRTAPKPATQQCSHSDEHGEFGPVPLTQTSGFVFASVTPLDWELLRKQWRHPETCHCLSPASHVAHRYSTKFPSDQMNRTNPGPDASLAVLSLPICLPSLPGGPGTLSLPISLTPAARWVFTNWFC